MSIEIKCHKLEEILASKLVGLIQRLKVPDIFDLVYAILKNTEYEVDKLKYKSFLANNF